MSKIFNQVKGRNIKRNSFDLSHEKKLSLNMGDLIPILCQEVVPGDTFQLNAEMFMRLAPMVAPIMHRVNVYTHFFFVPNRIIWNDWENFITGGEDGQQNPVFPRYRHNEERPNYYFNSGQLADYLGVPQLPSLTEGDTMDVNALPFRAYAEIFNEYYRDQNLVDPIPYSKGSGIFNDDLFSDAPDGMLELFTIRKRAWEKDYFTSALPWAQKGGSVNLPLQGSADITMDTSGAVPRWDHGPTTNATTVDVQALGAGGTTSMNIVGGVPAYFDPNGSLKADMSTVTATTINELRQAFQLQKWLERNARAGSRYVESILAHFGVRSSDSRLQRPEYLGGGRSPVVISEVLQMSETTANSPQGSMAGHGVSVGNSHRFKRFFEEHGYVIGIMSVLPRTAYQQGLPRIFSKFDKFDYYWPEFAHLGEQEIKNQELYVDDVKAYNDGVFGYIPRYTEYKYLPSAVHGDFKATLNFWHMGRIFSAPPQLSSDFIEADPTHRVFAVNDPSEHKLWCQIYMNIKALRPIPVFSEPGLIDH